ncbi:MAG: histone deacetylase [Veillonellaceae bacterium]|nr:histone deacetylase [Veillonellaceae bacterium]
MLETKRQKQDKPALGLVFFPAFDWKISETHPERQERLLYTRDQLEEEGLLDHPAIREYNPLVADWNDIACVHVGAPDLHHWVTEAHRVSAGGAIAAAKALMEGDVKRAFALVRPPGHHAMRMVHGIRGFCTINIEAVMLAYIRRHYPVGRVTFVDTDVHHGDGSQDMFYHDPDTLYISFHQDGRTLYPGAGFMDEFGGPQAVGANVNIPLPPGTGDKGLHRVLTELVKPILDDFKPDLIINSAGQDNHFSDPLANMNVTAKGYAELAHILQADIAVLEGGYSVKEALPYVNTGIVLSMAGLDYSQVIEPAFDSVKYAQTDDVTRYIESLIAQWKVQWDQRDQLKAKTLSRYGDIYKTEKRIYYDETGISELRHETVRLYPHQVGWRLIDSQSTAGPYGHQHVMGMFIPWQADEVCRQEAYDELWRRKKEGQAKRYVIADEGKGLSEEL